MSRLRALGRSLLLLTAFFVVGVVAAGLVVARPSSQQAVAMAAAGGTPLDEAAADPAALAARLTRRVMLDPDDPRGWEALALRLPTQAVENGTTESPRNLALVQADRLSSAASEASGAVSASGAVGAFEAVGGGDRLGASGGDRSGVVIWRAPFRTSDLLAVAETARLRVTALLSEAGPAAWMFVAGPLLLLLAVASGRRGPSTRRVRPTRPPAAGGGCDPAKVERLVSRGMTPREIHARCRWTYEEILLCLALSSPVDPGLLDPHAGGRRQPTGALS